VIATAEAASVLPDPRLRDKVLYWVSTCLVSAAMVYSIFMFTLNDHFPPWEPHGPSAFGHLGLPPWFKWELTLAKVFGVLALWVPSVPRKLKDLAYAGFGLTLLSAVIAHTSVGDYHISPIFIADPAAFFCLLLVSYRYAGKLGR
jgi:hypothetical protein